jgi:hypothetical protein
LNGEYENIKYHTFPPVTYDRLMSWKAGNGRISVGPGETKPQNTSKDTLDASLPKGKSLVVAEMNLKLVAKDQD